MTAEPVTYFSAAGPRSLRTVGLIKVGSSRNPDHRARTLSTRVIGLTALSELPIRQLLEPFSVAPEEMRRRGFTDALGEWFYDTPTVRVFVAWVCENHPVLDDESVPDLAAQVAEVTR